MGLRRVTQPINASHENKHVIKPKALTPFFFWLAVDMKPSSVHEDGYIFDLSHMITLKLL